MATPIIMPRQGQSVESCIITKWHKAPGEEVKQGDILFSYETDKAAFEEESKTSGTLLVRFFNEGDDVPCLVNVAVVGAPGEDFAQFAPDGGTPASEPEAAPVAEEPAAVIEAPVQVGATQGNAGDALVSPRARAAAQRLGVNAGLATASGPNGRVIERDVHALAKEGPKATPAAMAELLMGRVAEGTGMDGRIRSADFDSATATFAAAPSKEEFVDEKLSNIRKSISKAMHRSLSELAQLTNHSSFDASNILALRKQLKASDDPALTPITLNDIILYAVSRVLKNHRSLNAHFLGESMRYFSSVNLGMAVDTPRGLIVPTIFKADEMSLAKLSETGKALAKSAQDGRISPDLITGGTFTVTNLGSLGVEMFTPIINPPQTAILGINNIIYRQKADGTLYPAMGLSLTYDHRVVDGAPAARFVKDLGAMLENFQMALCMQERGLK